MLEFLKARMKVHHYITSIMGVTKVCNGILSMRFYFNVPDE